MLEGNLSKTSNCFSSFALWLASAASGVPTPDWAKATTDKTASGMLRRITTKKLILVEVLPLHYRSDQPAHPVSSFGARCATKCQGHKTDDPEAGLLCASGGARRL